MLNRFSKTSIVSSSVESLEERKLMSASYDIGINLNDNASASVSKLTPILKNLGVKTLRLWNSVSNFSNHAMTGTLQRAIDYANAGFNITLEINPSNGTVPSASAVKGWFQWAASQPALKAAVDQWEVGNEPDHDQYWKGTLSQYVTGFLKPAYEALNPLGEDVISAGPSWNVEDVRTMINAGMLSYTDYVGFHPYANGVSGVKKAAAAINSLVAGRKPIAVTEWNVRGYEGDKTSWAQAVQEVFPTIKASFALNYYFAAKTQNSLAGPGGILTSSFAPNQPFYNAFATFKNSGTVTTPTTGTDGNSASGGTGSITGTIFNDTDADGIFDSKEAVTGSRQVFLDTNANGKLDAGEKSVYSNSKGVYTFSGLGKGTFNVTRVFPSGYKLSNNNKGYVPTTVAVGQQVKSVNLGTTPSSTPVVTSPTTPTTPTTPVVTTPSSSTSKIVSLLLINASTDQVIGSMPVITGNTTVKLALLPKTGINIKVVTSGTVGSVKTTALGKTTVENNAPFSVFGDNNGDYVAYAAKKGSITVSSTAYTGANATGKQGTTLTATITFA